MGELFMHNWQTGILAILVALGLAAAGEAKTAGEVKAVGEAKTAGEATATAKSAAKVTAKGAPPSTGSRAALASVLSGENDFSSPEVTKKYIQEYDVKLKKNPRDFVSLYYRGRCYSNLRNSTKAIADWNRALAVIPYKEGMPEKAVVSKHLERAESFWSFCYQNRGYQYFKLGKLQEGIDDTTKAISIYPDYPINYKNRAVAYRRLGMTSLADADMIKFRQLSALPLRGNSVRSFDGPD
jgi:tetratricopeptide (TPR) repeat protein